MPVLEQLAPQSIWKNFEKINAVPRPSKKEERIIEFMLSFGKSLGLQTERDEIGNVIIKKLATPGMESRKTVILQSHLDMVHQKNNQTDFDFITEGIQMKVDGDFVKAKETTLGADNGLGVATIMAVLENEDEIKHPPIEALFTIDEETGMTGAKELDASKLSGAILINLDTEEDDEIGIGCAGGVDITFSKTYQEVATRENSLTVKLLVNGLNGGHSGMDIHKGFGNANKLLAKILFELDEQVDIQLHEINGGGLRNAIPREAEASISFDKGKKGDFDKLFYRLKTEMQKEFSGIEKNLSLTAVSADSRQLALSNLDKNQLLATLYTIHHGVYRMSPSIAGLVETSNNLARINAGDGSIEISCLTRSAIESGKQDLSNQMKAVGYLGGFKVNFSGDYPGWSPNPESPILDITDKIYKQQNPDKPHIAACHAGLECGILSQHLPEVDMVSIGPTILGAHSPDERANIQSVDKFWRLLKGILADIPAQ